jgi:hypothetical protein
MRLPPINVRSVSPEHRTAAFANHTILADIIHAEGIFVTRNDLNQLIRTAIKKFPTRYR